MQCVRRRVPYECAESSHAVEQRSRATYARETPTLMLVKATYARFVAAHRFFLVSVHASSAKKRTCARRRATRRGGLDGAGGVACSPTTVRRQRAGSAGFRGRKNAAFVRSGTNAARARRPCGAEKHRAAKIRSPYAQTRRPTHRCQTWPPCWAPSAARCWRSI